MNGYLIRVLVALALAGFLWAQARRVRDRPHRRRAFELGAAALLALAAYNGTLVAGVAAGPLQVAVAVVGVALFFGAVVSLLLSLRGGELREQRDQIAAAAREYRERREEQEHRRE
ncbi:MAG TPA: hypothetical protein VF909_07655 [Roseiflexaceae bacterium]